MPGVPMVIGSHNNTIFLRKASQFCSELDTKEETVSRLVQRSFRRIRGLARNTTTLKQVWCRGFGLKRVARRGIKTGLPAAHPAK
jgi:hypothetical protein